MPNTEVKLTNAESTWPEAAREDRKLLIKEKTLTKVGVFFSYAGASYPDGLPGIGGEHLLKERRVAQKIVKRLRRGEIGSC